MEKRPHRKRLSLDLPIRFHKEIKSSALRHNVTMTKLLLRLIHAYLIKERSYQNEDVDENPLSEL